MKELLSFGLAKPVLAIALILAAVDLAGASSTEIAETDVFTSGTNGYAAYRIPAIAKTTSGTLLAFCEARKFSASDTGQIDTVLRRSADGGHTWGTQQLVWGDGANTCGNPAPVVDASNRRIWLLLTWNLGTDKEKMIHDDRSSDTRRIFVTHSDSDGATWTPPEEITTSVKSADWRWYATGPGHAIQLSSGRLVVPANHSGRKDGRDYSSSHAIFSDDHGKTWRHGEEVGPGTNESTVAPLDDGGLYINMRSARSLKQRAIAWSNTGGETWTGLTNDPTLIEPVCQGSLLRHPSPEGHSLFFFSNPASQDKRMRMTVRTSTDQCHTWSNGCVIHEGPAAYSDLCTLDANTIGLLYESDTNGKLYARITFARIPVSLLVNEDVSSSTQVGKP